MFTVEVKGIKFTATTMEKAIEMATAFESSPVVDGNRNQSKGSTEKANRKFARRQMLKELRRSSAHATHASTRAFESMARSTNKSIDKAKDHVIDQAGILAGAFGAKLLRLSAAAQARALRHMPREILKEAFVKNCSRELQKGGNVCEQDKSSD